MELLSLCISNLEGQMVETLLTSATRHQVMIFHQLYDKNYKFIDIFVDIPDDKDSVQSTIPSSTSVKTTEGNF